jgi:hypothetical protein
LAKVQVELNEKDADTSGVNSTKSTQVRTTEDKNNVLAKQRT